MKAEECILFQLIRTTQSARKFLKTLIGSIGLTTTQSIVLNFLYDEDHLPANILGEKAAIDNATLTGLIDRLVAMGRVERQANPDDRRAIFICLTEEGRMRAEKVNEFMKIYNREFLSMISEGDEAVFRDVLDKIHRYATSHGDRKHPV